MTTQTKPKESFYLARLKEYLFRDDTLYRPYWKIGEVSISRYAPLTNEYLTCYTENKLVDVTFEEQEYKQFQIIVACVHYELRTVLDRQGQPFFDYPNETDIGGYSSDVKQHVVYASWVYDIGTTENTKQIHWLADNSCASLYAQSGSAKQTLKKTQKKVDLLALIKNVKPKLISMVEESLYSNEGVNPFNASVGDEVFISAFGRYRKGIVVSTTGSRFNVGYLTPSNITDLKYKTLRLDCLWVKQ